MTRPAAVQQPEAGYATLEEANAAAKDVICRGHGCPGYAEPYWTGALYSGYVLRCTMNRDHRITAPGATGRRS